MQQARGAQVAVGVGEHAGAGLHRAEEHADESLPGQQDGEARRQEAAGAVVMGVVGGPGGRVQREPGSEDQEQPGREGDGRRRAGHADRHADQGGSDDEGRLVGRALVGEGRLHEPSAALALGPRHGCPPHPGQRADLGDEEAGRGGGRDQRRLGRPAAGQRHQQEEQQPAGHRLHRDDHTLPDAVGESAGERRADGIRDGQGAGREAARAVGAARLGDQQQRAHLRHRGGQAAQEGDEHVDRSGQGQQPAVGGESGHGSLEDRGQAARGRAVAGGAPTHRLAHRDPVQPPVYGGRTPRRNSWEPAPRAGPPGSAQPAGASPLRVEP